VSQGEKQPEANFRVTLVVPGSSVDAVAKTTKAAAASVAVENVQKIEPFVKGEWSQLVQGDRDDEPGKPIDGQWVNTDGRRIFAIKRVKPGHEKKWFDERQWIEVYVVRDDYGRIDVVNTLHEAMELVRPVSTTREMLEKADTIAKIVHNLGGNQTLVDEADEYLGMRRIAAGGAQDGYDDPDRRRKPKYRITLDVEGSRKDTVMATAKGMFGKMLVAVELVRYGGSRAEDLEAAQEKVEEALQVVSELRSDLEDWKENMPENFQGSFKEEELETAISNLEDIENSLEGVGWDVEFPGMF